MEQPPANPMNPPILKSSDDRYLVSPWIPLEQIKVWLNAQSEEYQLTNVIRSGDFLACVMIKVPPGHPIQVLPPILF